MGRTKEKANNGKANDRPKNKDISKEEQEKKKEQSKTKKGNHRRHGPEHKFYLRFVRQPADKKVEVTYYLNDVSDPMTKVLMTYGEDEMYNAAYTYGLERIEVEAIDKTRPEAQDPLYYLNDSLGSITFMVKPDGNIRDHYRYDEFGTPEPGAKLSEDGRNVLHSSFGYTGELWDEESNLLYLRARYYEPGSGKFLSRDSYEGELENPLSKHLYLYVENNPVNFTDPSGHQRYVHYGSWGKDVRELQFRLISINFKPNGGADGYFGSSTENMVNKYKESRDLNNEGNYWGWVGRFTWKKLLKESKMPDYKGKVVLLNASEAVLWGEGHEAILMIKPDRSAWYYSFSRGRDEKAKTVNDNIEWKQYSPKDIDKGTKSLVDKINKEFRKGLDPYNREFTIYYFTSNQIQNMLNYTDVRRVYNVATYNCVNYVQGALRSGGLWEPGGMRPNVWHESMNFNYFTN